MSTTTATKPHHTLTTLQCTGASIVLTALVFLPLHANGHIRWISTTLITAICLAAGIAITRVDLAEHRIPNRITAPLAATLATFVVTDASTRFLTFTGPVDIGLPPGFALLSDMILGVLLAGGVFFAIGMAGATGAGDIKLAAIIGGIITPYYGIWATALALVLAHVTALPHAITAFAKRQRNPQRTNRIAFGPYLILGSFASVLYTHFTG